MRIPLTQGKFTIVDEEDADLAQYKWSALRQGSVSNTTWYAIRNSSGRGASRKIIYMHRVILERKIGRKLEKTEQTDHIKHDGLDNRRSKLRIVTHGQNSQNQRVQNISKSSIYKGVCYSKRNQWEVSIKVRKKQRYLGCFADEVEAAKAYDEAARLYFGDYAKLNFPEDTEVMS